MRLGVAIEETWDFFHEVYADLSAHHQTTLFKRPELHLPIFNGRVNAYRFRRDFQQFLRRSDVVFFEWASELLAVASHMPKSCGLVTRLHRYEMYRWADKVDWSNVDRVILVSQAKQQEFSAAFPEHAHKTIVIPEAVSLERFRPAPKPYNGDLGILCHMKPRKRVYELVLTFFELVQQRPGLHLHIGGGRAAGFEDYYDAVVQLVDRLGLRNQVTFYGHVDQPEHWYPKIDVFISNGYSEGLQVSPMEAMATGRYCLSHHWDGAEELLPEENLFYTDGALKALVLTFDAMSAADKDRESARLRDRVRERFDVDRTKVRIRQVIEEAAAAARAA